jgi:hypothetical protein
MAMAGIVPVTGWAALRARLSGSVLIFGSNWRHELLDNGWVVYDKCIRGGGRDGNLGVRGLHDGECRVAVVVSVIAAVALGVVVSTIAAVMREVVVEGIVDVVRRIVGDVHAVGAVSLIVVTEWSVGAVGGIAVISRTIDAVIIVVALHGGDLAVGTIGVDIMVSLRLDDRAEFSHLRVEMLGVFCCHRARSLSDDREPERGGQRTRSGQGAR